MHILKVNLWWQRERAFSLSRTSAHCWFPTTLPHMPWWRSLLACIGCDIDYRIGTKLKFSWRYDHKIILRFPWSLFIVPALTYHYYTCIGHFGVTNTSSNHNNSRWYHDGIVVILMQNITLKILSLSTETTYRI